MNSHSQLLQRDFGSFLAATIVMQSESFGTGVLAEQTFRKFLSLLDRVLVERTAAETAAKGSMMLPEKKVKEKY